MFDSQPSPACKLDSVFQPGKVILDYKDLKYNPCDDVIFPGFLKTAGLFDKPLDAYYLYYAAHDAPAGICVAHGPALVGPWTERPGNPIIAKDWPPHYHVGHVCSPHPLWVPEESQLFLYYHGDNDKTHYAVSKDGLNFTYGGIALDKTSYADYLPGTMDRIFYGRAYAHTLPSRHNKYIMLIVRESNQGRQFHGIYLSWSQDARQWSTPVRVATPPADAYCIWSPCLFTLNGKYYMAYHAERGRRNGYPYQTDMAVDEFDADFAVRKPLGRLLDPRIFGETNPRAADPVIIIEGQTVYLMVTIDGLHRRLAYATAKVEDFARALAAASRTADAATR